MRFKKTFVSLFIIMIVALLTCSAANARELKPDEIISAANIDRMLNDTFEGKKLSDLLTDKQQWRIRKTKLKIRLMNSEPWPVDKRWIEANKKYNGTAKYNAQTGLVEGYVAGECFSNITMDDPNAGMKLLWNSQKTGGYPRGDDQWIPNFIFLFIDGDKGLTKTQKWAMLRVNMQGRLTGDSPFGDPNDPNIMTKTSLFAWAPYDIAGLGTYAVRYHDGRMDDTWAYLRSVRRTRRTSGGGWFDPIGGTDMLQDDKEVLDVNPTWYKGAKLLGKRFILHPCRSLNPAWDPKMPAPWNIEDDTIRSINLAEAPYWNPNTDFERWMPREVWVIEVITPDAHPYGKKILYLDTQIPLMLQAEAYDKKGDFWRQVLFCMTPIKTNDGGWGVLSNNCHVIDYQRNSATVAVHAHTTQWNAGVDPKDLTVQVLQQASGGQWRNIAKKQIKRENP